MKGSLNRMKNSTQKIFENLSRMLFSIFSKIWVHVKKNFIHSLYDKMLDWSGRQKLSQNWTQGAEFSRPGIYVAQLSICWKLVEQMLSFTSKGSFGFSLRRFSFNFTYWTRNLTNIISSRVHNYCGKTYTLNAQQTQYLKEIG